MDTNGFIKMLCNRFTQTIFYSSDAQCMEVHPSLQPISYNFLSNSRLQGCENLLQLSQGGVYGSM